jgi:hypothetical protein
LTRSRARRRIAAGGAGLAVLAITVGCSGSSLTIDVGAPESRGVGLAASGTLLDGEVASGHACFWVTLASGEVVSLVWPPGSTAKDGPLRVVDSSGTTIAKVGDSVAYYGGHGLDGPGCHGADRRFLVETVGLD